MEDGKPQDLTVLEDVFETITSFEWLERAYRNARKQKRYRPEVLAFGDNLDAHLLGVQRRLRDGTFIFGPYRRHWVYVPKHRLVMALPFASRIVQWAIYQLLNPFYDKQMIEDSYACRAGKGSLAAVRRLQYWLRLIRRKPGDWYYLKLDISKYFYRIDHSILMGILRRRIRDERLLELLDNIISHGGEKFGLPRFATPEETPEEEWLPDVGMPIGNLTSQLFANIYLNELDQYCKHALHIRYYIRYMDDVIILTEGKERAREYLRMIREFLLDRLHLDLNRKTAVRPAGTPIEFVGYIATAKRLRLRKSTTRRIKRAFRAICRRYFAGGMSAEDFRRRVASYEGMMAHCQSGNLRKRLNDIFIREREAAKTNHIQVIGELCEICSKQANIIYQQSVILAEVGVVSETLDAEIAEARERYVAVTETARGRETLSGKGGRPRPLSEREGMTNGRQFCGTPGV